MYHFRDTSSQSVLKNFSYCLFSSVHFHLLFINQCPLIFIVYPPMFLFFFTVCPQLSLFVLVVTNVFSFCLFFIHQSLLFIVIVYPPMSLLVLVVHQCLHLRFIVYSPMSPSWCCLSTIVSFGFGCSPISSSFIYCLSTCPMSSFGFVDPPMSLGFSCSPMSPFCYCMSTNVSF